MRIKCWNCGYENDKRNNVCNNCGVSLNYQENTPNKKESKHWIVIACILLILTIIIGFSILSNNLSKNQEQIGHKLDNLSSDMDNLQSNISNTNSNIGENNNLINQLNTKINQLILSLNDLINGIINEESSRNLTYINK